MKTAPAEITITKLTQSDVKIYDITDPEQLREIVDFNIITDAGEYSAVFETQQSGPRTFYLVPANHEQKPATYHSLRRIRS